jgi:hypothetical protein
VTPLSTERRALERRPDHHRHKRWRFSGRGKISAINGRLELAVILDEERELPRIGGSTTCDQFWEIGCITEEEVTSCPTANDNGLAELVANAF